MFSQLATVFSSQGVVLPASERIPVYKKKAEAPCDHKNNCSCFAPKFEQASTKLELSNRAKEAMAAKDATGNSPKTGEAAESGENGSASTDGSGKAGSGTVESGNAGARKADGKPINDDEQKQVEELAKRDREVKAHEAAHSASAGGNAKGGAAYEYETGPDGRQYAVGGHVDIDVSPVRGDPQATLQKAQTVQRAALAPADPSGQDRAVAAAAAQMAREAQKEANQSEGKEAAQGDGGRDPRRAYSRAPSRMGAGISVYA